MDYYDSPAPADCVLVHGAGGNNLVWRGVTKGLAGNARAIAVNLPGHPAGEITCRSIGEYAESLRSFMTEQRLSRPVLCGHSMGSATVLTLAVEHPEEVGGLILVGAGAKLGVDPSLVEGLRADPLKTIEQKLTPRSFFSIDVGLGREARAALSFPNLEVFLNDYLACNGFDLRARLPEVWTKTMIVCGEKDAMTPPKWSHYLHENISDSELYFVKDSGHMLPLEKPVALAGLVQSFLARFTG